VLRGHPGAALNTLGREAGEDPVSMLLLAKGGTDVAGSLAGRVARVAGRDLATPRLVDLGGDAPRDYGLYSPSLTGKALQRAVDIASERSRRLGDRRASSAAFHGVVRPVELKHGAAIGALERDYHNAARKVGHRTALSLLEKDGAIQAKRGVIVILDRTRLRKISNGAYGAAEAEFNRLFG